MKLLDPSAIKADKEISSEQSAIRNRKLAAEESRLAVKINQARENASSQISKIDADLDDYRKKCELDKSILESEIKRLYEKRNELLRPIDEIKKEAERVLAEVSAIKSALDDDRKSLQSDKEKNQEFAESLMDREDELDEREEKLNSREIKIDQEAKVLTDGAENLKGKWVVYYTEVNNLQKNQENFEKQLAQFEIEKRVLDVRSGELAKQSRELDERKRALVDGFIELQKARDEILGRTT